MLGVSRQTGTGGSSHVDSFPACHENARAVRIHLPDAVHTRTVPPQDIITPEREG